MNRPEFLIWLITARCNGKCKHCYAKRFTKNENELTTEEAIKIIQEAKEIGVEHIGFTGGEAFLRYDFVDLLKECANLGITTSVVTNGSTLTDDVLKKIKEYNVFIYLSVDGAKEETHNFIRGNGSWNNVINAAERMNYFNIPFATIFAINKMNYKEMGEYVYLVKKLGAVSTNIIPVIPTDTADNSLIINSNELIETIKNAEEAANELSFHISCWCIPFADLIINSNYVHNTPYCRNWLQEMDIDPQGNVLLCDTLDIKLSNIKKGIMKAWIDQETHSLCNALYNNQKLQEPCKSCKLVKKCNSGCYSRAKLITGDIFAPDPLCPKVSGILL